MTAFADSQPPPALSAVVEPELYRTWTSGEIASMADPYPLYRQLQRDHPVAEVLGAVSVFRYDDVTTVLQHPEMSTDDRNSAAHQAQQAQGALSAPYLAQLDDQSFLHRDPPEHTRLRKLLAKGFTPRRVEALRGFIPALRRGRARRSRPAWWPRCRGRGGLPVADRGDLRADRHSRHRPRVRRLMATHPTVLFVRVRQPQSRRRTGPGRRGGSSAGRGRPDSAAAAGLFRLADRPSP